MMSSHYVTVSFGPKEHEENMPNVHLLYLWWHIYPNDKDTGL